MPTKNTLKSAERDVFRQVATAAFSNPFGSEHFGILRTLAGDEKSTDDVASEKATRRIRECVKILEDQGRDDFRTYSGEDRDILRPTVLFDVFRRFMSDFDQLILDQILAGNDPCPVPFGKEALSLLADKGFSPVEATRYFSFFYQLRRAFYFIDNRLVGKSPSMTTLRIHLWQNIFTHDTRLFETHLWNRMEDFSTFLVGETGTGKGTAGAAIGRSGYIPFDDKKERFAESFTQNFLEINLSQYPEALIESELFGHKKGSFTGAVENHKGILGQCRSHGAIFLDEIGDVSIPIQIKLLKVLQERTFSMVGSHEKQRFRGRVIAATNQPLDTLRREGRFRDDFYYRLCSDIILVPSLRQQISEDPETLHLLLSHTIRNIMGEPDPELTKAIYDTILKKLGMDYPWPGNVRELEQAVRRFIITQTYEGDMKPPADDLLSRIQRAIETGTMDAQGLLSQYCKLLYHRYGTYGKVADITLLDRRTVKKYIEQAEQEK